ncbi:uncharacterized protein LOC108106829 [Drosophila eugracilis]|uniref:uncharacterized protein LOC108106829 n=1 Tax=Drosophila eugracilis TaxID=29029 RepID=UPI001BD9C7C0|nr:uncharacterized protein LOC108106829 [Drosophila eugracilis]
MCKFTNRLFVFALLLLPFAEIQAKPFGGKIRAGNSKNVISDFLDVLYDDYSEDGFQREDILYDQRQKGDENYQLKVDGMVIGVAPQLGSNLMYSLAEYYLSELMLRKQGSATQMFEKDPVIDPESVGPEGVTDFPELSKTDMESSKRSPSQLLQLLKMIKVLKPKIIP